MGQVSVVAMIFMALTLAALWGIGHAFASGEGKASSGRIMLAYFLLLVPVIIGAFILEYLAFTILDDFTAPSLWAGVTLNLVPAFLAGFALYAPLSRRLNRLGQQSGRLRPHLRRCFGLYLVALLLGTYMAVGLRSPGFWMFVQIILWPFTAVLGGIAADAVALRRQVQPADTDA